MCEPPIVREQKDKYIQVCSFAQPSHLMNTSVSFQEKPEIFWVTSSLFTAVKNALWLFWVKLFQELCPPSRE